MVWKGRQEQIREVSRNSKNRVCLPVWNFCSFPTVRLSRYHHQLAPKISTQWHLGSDISHDKSSVLRPLSVSCHILASLLRSLCRARSGVIQVQRKSGTDSIAQSCLCHLTFIQIFRFQQIKTIRWKESGCLRRICFWQSPEALCDKAASVIKWSQSTGPRGSATARH